MDISESCSDVFHVFSPLVTLAPIVAGTGKHCQGAGFPENWHHFGSLHIMARWQTGLLLLLLGSLMPYTSSHGTRHQLRRAFTVWLKRVFLPARLPHVSLPDVQDIMEVQAMLAERVIEWTQQWKEEGLREGIQQGIQQGQAEERRRTLAAERALLLRLVRKRFGEGYTQALPPVLEARQDTESLAEIGEWIVTCQTGEEFLTKVQERFPSSCER